MCQDTIINVIKALTYWEAHNHFNFWLGRYLYGTYVYRILAFLYSDIEWAQKFKLLLQRFEYL